MSKLNIWGLIQNIANGSPINSNDKKLITENIHAAIEDSWGKYQALPVDKKQSLCIELANSMGCKSTDYTVCSKFLYKHAWGN